MTSLPQVNTGMQLTIALGEMSILSLHPKSDFSSIPKALKYITLFGDSHIGKG